MDLRLILVLCALAATRVASQSDTLNGQCAKQCKSSELNEYPNGLTHVYKYSTRTLVNSWKTQIDVSGQVLLTRLSTCDYSLELRDVSIKSLGSLDARPMEEQLKARSMRFSWIDGEITDVCHHPEEEEWVINVKKAILSSLQVVGTSGYVSKVERDILGDCQTTYQQGDIAHDRIVMFKTKDIASCEYHTDDKLASAIETVLTPGKPEYQCKQTWSSRYILKSVKCGHVAPTQTQVIANLTMEYVKTETKSMALPLASFRRSQLHASRVELPKKTVAEVTNSLITLCQSVATQIKSQSPLAFREFSQSLETLRYNDLKKVWDSLIAGKIHESCSNERVKVMFVDAILQSRTGAGLKLAVKDLHKGNYISEMKLKAAVYSLIYTPRPCIETMDAISELLRSEKSFVQTLFGMTAAIQRYYEITHDRTTATVALDLIIARLHKAEENEKVVIARALSNIRFDAEKLIKAFEKYLESGKPELKVAVIEALNLIDSCYESVYNKIRPMVLSTSQPNEIRIRALKVYLRCADESAVSELKRYIESRPEDQHFVSYAHSYLENALKTMNPDKQVVKSIARLGQSEWKEPKMTMARNIEFSKMTPEGQFGLNYEIDSILEKGQEVPTWVVLNSSIPVRRVNALNFEIGVRQEGLNKLATKLFNQISQIKVQKWEKIVEEAKERKDYQPIVNELTKIIEEIKQLAEQTAKVSAYIKINGVTLFYLNAAESSFDRRESIQRFFIENTEARKAIEASLGWIFVDYKVNTPLASGLSLRYKQEGSIIPGLKATLKSQTKSENVFGLFPNFAAEIVYGRELVLLKPVASNLVRMNVNSDVALEGIHTLVRSGVHKFVLNTKDEMDLIKFEISKIAGGEASSNKQVKALRPIQKWCSTEYTEKIFGLVFCFDGQEEVSALRMKEDVKVIRRLYTKKTDTSLKNYELIVKMEEGIRGFAFDTPNTKVNRKVEVMVGQSGDFQAKKNFAGKFWVSVNSPVKSFDVNVSAAFPTGQEWIVALDSRVDRQLHSVKLTLAPKSNRQHILNFMVNSPVLREKMDYDLTFTSPMEAGNELMAQIHSNRSGNKRNRLALIKVIRSQQDQNKLAKLELELNNERAEKIIHLLIDGSIKGTYSAINAIQYNGKVEYRRRQGKMETVQINGNHKVDTTGEAKSYTTSWELKTTQWPQINGKATHKMFKKMSEHLENEMELRWGRDYDQESTLNRIVLRQVSSAKTVGKNTEMKTTFIAENRARQFNHKLESKVIYVPKTMELFRYEVVHSDLNRPENNHKMTIDHKITGKSEGTLNVAVSSSRHVRSIKTTYSLDRKNYKLATLFKTEIVGDAKSVQGYHVSANLNRETNKHMASFEISTHPTNKQIFKTEVDLDRQRSKALANVKISYRESPVVTAEYERNTDQIKGKMTIPRSGSIEANLDRRMQSVRFVTKNNNDWSHELVAAIGQVKELKSKTLSGIQTIPNFEILFNPINKSMKFALRSSKVDLHCELKDYANEPTLRVEYSCAEHQVKHMTDLKWMKESMILASEHETKGAKVYTVRIAHELKNEEQLDKLNLQIGKFETRVQNLYHLSRRSNKFDFISTGNNMEAKIQSRIALPATRGRFSRMAQLELPKFEIKANFKKDNKETSMLIANEQLSRIHLQHRNRNTATFVVDSKFDSEKWTIIGNAGDLKYNLAIVPSAAVKSFDLAFDGYGRDAKLVLALTEESTKWIAVAESKFTLNGEKKFDEKTEIKVAKNLIAGPHSYSIKNFGEELNVVYKLVDNKLELTLTAADEGKKIIDAKLNGEKFVRGKVCNVAGKLELSSDKYASLRQAVYEVKYNRDGRKVDVAVEKKGTNPMNMKLSADIALESAKVNAEMNGRTVEGKQRKLVIDYNRLNKIDFSAKLYDMTKVDSEVGVSIPLVRIAEFIGNEASFYLKSKSFNSEATFSLKAPSKTSITGLANIKIQGQQWFQYNMAINDGSSVKFFGVERVDNQLTNPIAVNNEILFKGRQIFTHNLMVSDKLISFKTESPNLFKVNQAFVMKEKVPEILGKYCYKVSCSKMTSKWTLGQKGLIDMNIEGPKGAEQKYDIYIKWNAEEGKEYGSALLVKNQRQYGYEWSRMVKNDLKTVYETKFTLPKRVMTILTTKDVKTSSKDKFIGAWTIVITPKENAEPLRITLDRSVKRSSNNLKYDHHVTFEHKTLHRPIKMITSLNIVKSDARRSTLLAIKSVDMKVALNYEGGNTHDLNASLFCEVNEDKLDYNWRVWQKEEKIDFGCTGDYLSTGTIKSKLYNSLKNYSCHWVDRNGKRNELKREQKISMGSDILGGLPRITFHDNLKHPLGSYFYNGTFHLFEAIKDATIDFHTEDGQRYQLQGKFDTTKQEKCLEMILFEKTNEQEKYGLRACFNPQARQGKSVLLFEMITFGKKVNMIDGERKATFSINRMKDFANDYLVSLIWDTYSMGLFSEHALDAVEEMSKQRTVMINERNAELKDKMDYIRSSIGEKINKAKNHFNTEMNEISNEMKPELDMLLRTIKNATRSKRAINFGRSDRRATLSSPMTYEWKEYDFENGRLELILRNVEAHKVPEFVYRVLLKKSLI